MGSACVCLLDHRELSVNGHFHVGRIRGDAHGISRRGCRPREYVGLSLVVCQIAVQDASDALACGDVQQVKRELDATARIGIVRPEL
jgi:hypothetical protein